MPAILGVNNGQYTITTTAGTTTINQGNAPQTVGVLYGVNQIALGTTPVVTALDIYVSGTTTTTATIMTGTGTVQGQAFSPGIGSTGVRYRGSLVLVTSGTAASWLTLWD